MTPTPLSSRHGLGLSVLLSAVIIGLLSWLHYASSDAFFSASQQLREFREARSDLTRGFLAISLADESGAPYNRGDGIALLHQSIEVFDQSVD